MSILTLPDLRARCTVDSATHCWLWQGALASHGIPRMHTLDYARTEKRTMSGPSAAWHIAHGEAPCPGTLVFRACGQRLCLNPAHLKLARSKAEIGVHIRRAGTRKGTYLEQRRASQKLAMAASGRVPTDAAVVRAIRAEPAETTTVALAARLGMPHQTVSRIRRGDSHRGVA